MRKNLIRLSAIAAAMAASCAAQAIPIYLPGQSDTYFNNYENLYRVSTDCATNCLGASVGDPAGYRRVDQTVANNVKIGDIFAGILTAQNVTTTTTGTNSYDSTPGNRFTGYFAQEVKGITGALGAAIVTLGTVGADPFGKLAAGEMFRFYSDVPTFSSGGTVTTGIAAATAGNFWSSMGLGAEGYFYSKTDLTVPINTSNTQSFFALDIINKGAYNAGTLNKVNDFNEDLVGGVILSPGSMLCNAAETLATAPPPTAVVAGPNSTITRCTDIVGNSKIQTNAGFTTGTSPWQFQSNDPFSLNRVPEPGTLALVGLSLAALGLVRQRRNA